MGASGSNKAWKFEDQGKYLILKFLQEPKSDGIKEFSEEWVKYVDRATARNVVVNCSNVGDLPNAWTRSLLQFQKGVVTAGLAVRFIQVSKSLESSFKSQGLNKTFVTLPSMREALIALGVSSKRSLDVGFINPFLGSTVMVLERQAKTSSKPGAIKIISPEEPFHGDVSGVLGLVSDAFKGSVVITFPEATFLKVMSRMLGEEFKVLNKDLIDGAAELTNMVFGQAKVALNEKGYGLQTAIPSVVSGRDHRIQGIGNGPRIRIPFETDIGSFSIEICISDDAASGGQDSAA